MHKLHIKMDGPGRGEVHLDGKPVEGVTGLEFGAGVGTVSRLKLEMNIVNATIDAEDVSTEQAAAPTVRSTEAEIARLLARLERFTNAIVRDVAIESVDVTKVGDERRQYMRRVRIDIAPEPGAQWVQDGKEGAP